MWNGVTVGLLAASVAGLDAILAKPAGLLANAAAAAARLAAPAPMAAHVGTDCWGWEGWAC